MELNVSGVGHVVIKVRDLERSSDFYCGVLGLHEVARRDFGEGPMAFLSVGGSHHDLALVAVGADTAAAPGDGPGLHHVALKVGDDLDRLRAARAHLESHGVPIRWALDHRVSQGLYVADPDGNLIELYVDADPDLWRDDPAVVATSDPLEL